MVKMQGWFILSALVVLIQLVRGSDRGYGNNQAYQQKEYGYKEKSYGYYKEPTKNCYQCAYSPPKTYYDKKVVVEKYAYGQQKHDYQQQPHGYGDDKKQGYGKHGGYTKKTYVPVARTVYGGWDKCFGTFDHYQAKDYGIDVWECHSNCYVRKDPNGDIFRGCYKGEYGVDPHKNGCSYQAGSLWCFCEGDKCNNQNVGQSGYQH